MTHPRRLSRRAFSLIEIMMVVSVLAILGAIVIPRFTNSRDAAEKSALATTVHGVNTKLTNEYANGGEWPAAIEAAWFIGGEPRHAQNGYGVPMVQVVTTDGLEHPADKVLKAGVGGAYWYNAEEGIFRARVSDQGSAAATLLMYNEVNNCDASGLGNYGGGGGGGGS